MLFLTLHTEEDREKFYKRHTSLTEQIEIINTTLKGDPATMEALEKLKSSAEDILKFGQQLLDLYDKDPTTFNLKNHKELVLQFHNAASKARSTAIEIASLERSRNLGNVEEAKAVAVSIQQKIPIITALSVILAIILGILISKSISKPIIKLKKAMEDISKDKFGEPIESLTKDEVGELTASFNKMTADLKKSRDDLLKANKELENSKKELEMKNKELDQTLEDFYTVRLNMQKDMELGRVEEENKKIKQRLDRLRKKRCFVR
jgi:nitrogen fixation/metabolism regulation signal transduction histidine kinase